MNRIIFHQGTSGSWRHHFCRFKARGDRGRTMSSRLVKIVEFSHLGEFYSFDRENKGYGKRNTQNEVTVCVAFDIS